MFREGKGGKGIEYDCEIKAHVKAKSVGRPVGQWIGLLVTGVRLVGLSVIN